MIDFYEFSDYREILRAVIRTKSTERGYQSRMAEAAGCKQAFLSQVLHSHINLTPDHGAGLCLFWKLDEDTADFFMELLALARAGSEPMRILCRRRIVALRGRRSNLTERLRPTKILKKETQAQYYSSWIFAAVHMLSCIPKLNTAAQIATRLNVREETIMDVLGALEKMELLARKQGKFWLARERDLHISKSATLNALNHSNWRQRVLSRIQELDEDSFHYTAVHSISKKDLERIKECLTATIKETREIVKPSPEEEVICLTMDLIRV